MARQQQLLDAFCDFYNGPYKDNLDKLGYHSSPTQLKISYEELADFDVDVAEDWIREPDEIADHAREALRVCDVSTKGIALDNLDVVLTNLSECISPSELSATDVGTLVSVEGTVIENREQTTRVLEGAFKCQRCGTLNYIQQDRHTENLVDPAECVGCERKGPYTLNRKQSVFCESQWGRVEGWPDEDQGEVPQSVEVYMTGGGLELRKDVVLTGIVRLRQDSGSSFDIIIDGRTVDAREYSRKIPSNEEYLGVNQLDSESLTEFANRSRRVIHQGGNLDEDNTMAKIITPFVHMLGWDVFDRDSVQLNYPRDNSEFTDSVDYALFGDEEQAPSVLIEAKQVGVCLDDHTGEIKRYLRLFGGDVGVLTNGERYMVFRSESDGSPEETLVTDCTVDELDDNEIVSMISASVFGN